MWCALFPPPASWYSRASIKLGTSLRFIYLTSSDTYQRFKEILAALPPGGFIERPMGAFDTVELPA